MLPEGIQPVLQTIQISKKLFPEKNPEQAV